jgi:UDP-N-acetylmuramoyl-tripeptide--D-alanyl-D-alanine ligase
MKKILRLKLKIIAKLMILRYRPKIVAVSGSVGKTSTKNAIYQVVSRFYLSRKSYKSYNNQIGVPLTILGFETPGRNIFGWLKIFAVSFFRLIYQSDYPEILVLEMGSDRKGDIRYLTSIAKPDISVLTKIGSSHLEHFGSKEAIIEEKSQLVKSLKKDGVAILNFDDKNLRTFGLNINREVLFYGRREGANFRADRIRQSEKGLSFKVEAQGNSVPIKNIKAYGVFQVYNVLAALATGSGLGLDLLEMAEAIKNYRAEKGRANIIKGKKQTIIIDDSYNSSPESAKYSLELLDEISKSCQKENCRKVAILGDMLELGKTSKTAHIKIGKLAGKISDLVIFVGSLAQELAKGAQEELDEDDIKVFSDYEELNGQLLSIIKKDDIVLIKGSQGVRLDLSVKKLMSDRLDPSKVLVRQTGEWLNSDKNQ